MTESIAKAWHTRVAAPITVLYEATLSRWTMQPGKVVFREVDEEYPVGKTLDAWRVRNDFLLPKMSPETALEFLNDVGRFSITRPMPRNMQDLEEWRELVRKLLQLSPNRWRELSGAVRPQKFDRGSELRRGMILRIEEEMMRISFNLHGRVPAIVIKTTTALGAIFATIIVDHLRRAKFKLCARQDCRRPFEVTSRHKRMYCEQSCAHLVSVRRTRRGAKARIKKRGR